MKSEVTGMGERVKRARIGLKDMLTLVDVTLEDQLWGSEHLFPYDVFEGLHELMARTIHGTKIERSRPKSGSQPFHTFEIHTEEGDTLGYLNMIFLRKPIPCYYLVYVEVLASFRGRGLGNKILKAFKEFVENKEAMGLLDNIIPNDEPTYDIYSKLGWKDIEEWIGESVVNGERHYMVFIPASLESLDLRGRLIKLLFKVKKKRPIIDMHDNESMVRRTISEFRSVYETLKHLFDLELSTGTPTPFMRFMFTKFITKVLGFRRRITTLLGYTGGESLDQISLSEQIKSLPLQSYSLWSSKEGQADLWGEERVIRNLPEELKREPTLYIESLFFYRRPYLSSWFREKEKGESLNLKIADILDLGFDPTRLREFQHEGVEYIFERSTPLFLSSIEKRRGFLPKIAGHTSGMRFRHATVQVNPPLVILQDKGNVYILRRKLEGIHFEEALDQLRTSTHLKEMNRTGRIDQAMILTVQEIKKELRKRFGSNFYEEIEDLTFFIPWNLESNMPRVTVDTASIFLDTLWIA
ncbi:MAG: GNAT family N-acetyltransferase [Thermodesulfobacteriota bacterium]|nr:GNAT family N-acetyltransferase [Thermodesulfobacteriota bacterium]